MAAFPTRDSATVLAESLPGDWREVSPDHTVYLELDSGRVVIELAPAFAPEHVARIEALAHAGAYDRQFVTRVQENYVVQWGDGDAPLPPGLEAPLANELSVRIPTGVPFALLPDGDVYAPQVGHAGSLPSARDPARGTAWLAHCPGMVGVGRGEGATSSTGQELYVVTGHGPRHLDRNVVVVGRVLQGIEKLTTLPRGTAPLGFYEKPEQRIPLRGLRLARDLPMAERTRVQVLRSDTATWQAFVAARRTRTESWFVEPVGRIELCNVPVPVRMAP